MSDVKKTREQIDAEINEVILVQGNQSAPALSKLFKDVLDYVDDKYLDDVEVKTLGGQSLVGTGDIPIDFGGAGFIPEQ